MSTKMTEADWVIALEAFRACLPARGAKARDDRLFLEALHYFAVHTISWRALPERFGKWNSVRKRLDRLGKAGVFEDHFAMLAGLSETAHVVQMFDSTVIRAHVSAAGAKGQEGQALGRSRGGFGTEIHLKTDHDGLPMAFELTGGEASDSPMFGTLIDAGPDEPPRAVVCDKGYDSDANRAMARARGAIPVIPHRANRKTIPQRFARALYRGRARIEQTIGKLKRFNALPCAAKKRRGTSDPSSRSPRRSSWSNPSTRPRLCPHKTPGWDSQIAGVLIHVWPPPLARADCNMR